MTSVLFYLLSTVSVYCQPPISKSYIATMSN